MSNEDSWKLALFLSEIDQLHFRRWFYSSTLSSFEGPGAEMFSIIPQIFFLTEGRKIQRNISFTRKGKLFIPFTTFRRGLEWEVQCYGEGDNGFKIRPQVKKFFAINGHISFHFHRRLRSKTLPPVTLRSWRVHFIVISKSFCSWPLQSEEFSETFPKNGISFTKGNHINVSISSTLSSSISFLFLLFLLSSGIFLDLETKPTMSNNCIL